MSLYNSEYQGNCVRAWKIVNSNKLHLASEARFDFSIYFENDFAAFCRHIPVWALDKYYICEYYHSIDLTRNQYMRSCAKGTLAALLVHFSLLGDLGGHYTPNELCLK